jgi:hypothetical protein
MEQIETRNILELLCLLDDVLLCKVLLEMEPKQMTILGSTCRRFYCLTTDRKLWKLIIKLRGLMPMLLRKKGGKKNLKRIRVMQKTYTAYWKAHKVADPAEIEKEKAIAHVRRMENMTRMSYIELSSTLGISYHCRHPIITFYRDLKKVRCDTCCSFSTDFEIPNSYCGRFLAEYLVLTKPTETILFFERPSDLSDRL